MSVADADWADADRSPSSFDALIAAARIRALEDQVARLRAELELVTDERDAALYELDRVGR